MRIRGINYWQRIIDFEQTTPPDKITKLSPSPNIGKEEQIYKIAEFYCNKSKVA
jgi:hypothetical protein